MQTLSIKRFGFAIACASVVSYLGCVFVMMTVPKDVAIRFINSLMHGVDVTTIMRWDMPMCETILGAVGVSVLGWLFGALIACCLQLLRKQEREWWKWGARELGEPSTKNIIQKPSTPIGWLNALCIICLFLLVLVLLMMPGDTMMEFG